MSGQLIDCPNCQRTIEVPYQKPFMDLEDHDYAQEIDDLNASGLCERDPEAYADQLLELSARQDKAFQRQQRILNEARKNAEKEAERKYKREQLLAKLSIIPIGILIVFFVAIFDPNSGCTWFHHGGDTTSPAESYNSWSRIASPCIGWVDSADFTKSRDLAISGDQAAWRKHRNECIITGKAVVFDAGTKVYIEDRAIWAERVLVREEGSTDSYWVSSQDVK